MGAQTGLELMAILLPWPPKCVQQFAVVNCYTSDTLSPHPIPYAPIVAAGFVFRQCGSDGQWGSWRDHTQCENPEKNGAFQVRGGRVSKKDLVSFRPN